MSSMLLACRATLNLYRDCAVDASKGLVRNWVVLLGSAAGVAATIAGNSIAVMAGPIIGNFLFSLLIIAVLTLYYSWIDETVDRETITFKTLLNFDLGLFFSIISVGFVLWIIEVIANAAEVAVIGHLAGLALVVFCNPLPEVIQKHRTDGVGGLATSFAFMKENWIEWLIPSALFLAPLFIYFGDNSLVIIASRGLWQGVLLPIRPVATGVAMLLPFLSELLQIALLILVSNWFMLFRAHLYRGLTGGSRRKRIYEMQAK